MNRRIYFAVGCLLFSTGVFISCQTDPTFDNYEQWQKDVQAIDNYLTSNNIDAVKDARGVRMVIHQLGTGLPAAGFNKVDIDYTGKLFSNASTFDDGNTKEVLTKYIQGWQIAMTTLPEGSEATVYIPSAYGYANVQQGPIPPNSILVFDLHFKEIVLSSAEETRFTTDTTAIDEYLANKGIAAMTDTTGVRYTISSLGAGSAPDLYDNLKLKYTIRTIASDANVVASVDGEPTSTFDSRMVDYIPGMVVGLKNIGPGGKITVYVPSNLGFGPEGVIQGGTQLVPANANLIVEIELFEIL
jgi:FKBP-type peptidyl-prolyl cis-trans isomerase